jgi:predicted membrane-bound spermidine synthase
MQLLLFLAFAVSGMAGLIYEVIWSRYLALFVGHSAYAQVLVIAVYLGGMAIGALATGERSKRLARPLLWYAGAEAILALLGFLFHPAFQASTGWAYEVVFPALAGTAAVGWAKWAVAGALILPQAVLLGTTFPLMTAAFIRLFPSLPGRSISLLYFSNSLGGALGVLAGGFLLVGLVGLPGTLIVAGILNLTAAATATGVDRSARAAEGLQEVADGVGAAESGAGAVAGADALAPSGPGSLWPVLLTVSFLTAVASFIYEIGWIRMLSLVMGGATHSFELMLSAFILGLAIGAMVIRQRTDGTRDPLKLLGWIQWLMGLAALATIPVYLGTFSLMGTLVRNLPGVPAGYTAFAMGRYGIALAVMLPSTVLAGMTLPLITTTLLRAGHGERSIGWVYGVNTLGSVIPRPVQGAGKGRPCHGGDDDRGVRIGGWGCAAGSDDPLQRSVSIRKRVHRGAAGRSLLSGRQNRHGGGIPLQGG